MSNGEYLNPINDEQYWNILREPQSDPDEVEGAFCRLFVVLPEDEHPELIETLTIHHPKTAEELLSSLGLPHQSC